MWSQKSYLIPLNLNFFICLTGLYYPACKGKCHQRGQKCVLSVHTRYFMKNRSSRSFLFVCWRIKFRVHISITTPNHFFPFCGLCSWCYLRNLCLSLHLRDCLLCSDGSDSRRKYPMCGLLGQTMDNYRVACDWQPTWGGNCCPHSSWHTVFLRELLAVKAPIG